jgi:uridine kinase
MIGDKLLITEYHRGGAAQALELIRTRLTEGVTLAITVAGESGSGKSEIGHVIAETLTTEGKKCLVLGQDDYFILPPRSNHERRQEDISWVGMGEVRLDLLDEHLARIKARRGEPFSKPLVYFEENRVGEESVAAAVFDVVVAEGTYTSALENADVRVFIDRNYRQTKKSRLARGRDPDVAFLEQVLEIEHGIISAHKARADVVIPPPPEERV